VLPPGLVGISLADVEERREERARWGGGGDEEFERGGRAREEVKG
jgi:hypothetical protein